jgi:Lipocalin-like domain
MNRRSILSLVAITAWGLAALPGNAVAQQKTLKEQLTGAWTLVSIENILPDGTKRLLYGANPKGTQIFDASGRWSQMQVRADRPKFKSLDRLQATAEESKAAMKDTLAQFGSWSVDEGSKTILLRIEGSLVPNSEGTDGKRMITSITADELKYTNPGVAAGGKNEVVYRRAK